MSIPFFQSNVYEKYIIIFIYTTVAYLKVVFILFINYLIDEDDSNGCTPCTSDPVVEEFSLLCVSETIKIAIYL